MLLIYPSIRHSCGLSKLLSPALSLLILLLAASPASASETAVRIEIENQATALVESGGQYLAEDCSPASLASFGYGETTGIYCRYSELGFRGALYLLLASPTQISEWVVNACARHAPNALETCSRDTFDHLWKSSNGQIPVAGTVVEPARVVTGLSSDSNVPMNFIFRDGITVRTILGLNGSRAQLTDIQMQQATTAAIAHVFLYARPVSATRTMLIDNGAPATIATNHTDLLDYLRQAHIDAWNSPSHVVVNAWVRSRFE